MRIEHISDKPDRAGRYFVRFEDGRAMRLYRQTIEDHVLYIGLELTEEQLSALREDACQTSAKMRAVRIVTASNISKADLQRRLVQKGEDPQQAAHAVAWMEELKLVDDFETATRIVSRCAEKGYGIARARQALYEKHIPREYWQDALDNYPDQTDKIVDYLRSRLSLGADERERKRAVDALLRRGHSYGDIRHALRQMDIEEFPEEYNG